MDKHNKPRVVGYCRTDDGDEGIAEQRTAIKAYAKKHGYDLVNIFDDVAVRGTTATGERPGFQQVAEVAERGKIDAVIVQRLDRIGRDLARVLPAVEWLRDQGVEVRSATERIDTSVPAGAAVFAVLGTLGVEPPEDAALLRRIYGLRRQGRSVREIGVALDTLDTPKQR
ncbi:MAG: recombinase family protein [Peptococcaceae bacterium]|jgi:DNA invertase Pin-like site-specific DNA recombinase|nr:recombinase family protein [Peptococcaceae bacterium]